MPHKQQYEATLQTLTPAQVAWVKGGSSGGGPSVPAALNITNQTEDRRACEEEPLVTQYSSAGRQIFAGFRLSL